jgi:arylsulfatase
MEKHQNTRRDPLFLYVAYTAPHWPLHALEQEIETYRPVYAQGWDKLREARYKRQLEEGVVRQDWPLCPRDASVPAWEDAPNKEWEAERMAVYAAQIDRLDQNVGRLLNAIPNNTLVLFLSDNGSSAEVIKDTPAAWQHTPWKVNGGNKPSIKPGPRDTFQSCGPAWAQVSNTPFRRYKMSVHEGGIATPLIAMWKGDQWKARIRNPGSLVHTPGHVIDIMPTCIDVAGATYPKDKTPLPGRSIVTGLEGKPLAPHEATFWEHEGNQAMREGRLKLVRAHGGPWELYDLESDRTELKDLAAVRPTTVTRMAGEYSKWMRRSMALPWDEARPAATRPSPA